MLFSYALTDKKGNSSIDKISYANRAGRAYMQVLWSTASSQEEIQVNEEDVAVDPQTDEQKLRYLSFMLATIEVDIVPEEFSKQFAENLVETLRNMDSSPVVKLLAYANIEGRKLDNEFFHQAYRKASSDKCGMPDLLELVADNETLNRGLAPSLIDRIQTLKRNQR